MTLPNEYETVLEWMKQGIEPQEASINDLLGAASWLEMYEVETAEEAQTWANAIGFLIKAAATKQKRQKLAEAKRAYAKEHGIKVSQVRVVRN